MNFTRIRKSAIKVMSILLLLTSLSACKKKDYGTLQLRFHHFAPGVSTLSWVYAGKDTVLQTSYLESSDYTEASLENLSFVGFADNIPVVQVSSPLWEKDTRHSVFVCDTFGTINKVMLSDAHDAAPAGKALIRFIHLVPDTIGITLLANGNELFDSKEFRYALQDIADGYSDFTAIDAGNYNFAVRTVVDSIPLDFSLLNAANIESGKTYNIVASGFANATAGLEMKLTVVPFIE